MKAVVLTIVLALALAGGATAGGPHLRELVERVGLLEAADVEQEAELAELALDVAELEAELAVLGAELRRLDWRTHAQLKCLAKSVRALERGRRPPKLCSARLP